MTAAKAAARTATGSSTTGAGASRSAVPAIVLALYTGATMLGGQVAWMRLAQAQVGSGLLAGAISLAGAMGGLAVGAGIAARRLARRPVGPIACWQQLLSAAALLGSPWLIQWAGEAAVVLLRAGAVEVELAIWPLAAAVGAVLAVLNLPFGMALAVAVELDVGHRDRHLSRRGGLFYAFQAGGAVLGAAGLGLALPAAAGYRVTLAVAGAGHLALAGWLSWLGRRWPGLRDRPTGGLAGAAGPGRRAGGGSGKGSAGGRAGGERGGEPVGEAGLRLPRRRSVLYLAAWLGMLGLAAELVWLRGLGFFLGSNVYVYGLTAGVFVGCLAGGGLVGAWLSPLRRRPGQFLAGVVLVIAVTVAASGEWLGRLPGLWGGFGAAGAGAGAFRQWAGDLWVVVVVVAPSAALMGVVFPLLVRLAGPPVSVEVDGRRRSTAGDGGRPGQAGAVVGRVAAFNAFGSVLGPLLAFGVVLALLDERRCLLALAIGYMLSALWAEVIDPATGWHRSSARAAPPKAGDRQKLTRRRKHRIRQATRYRIPWINIVLFVAAAGACLWQAEQGSVFRRAYLLDTRVEYDAHGAPKTTAKELDEDAETRTFSLQLVESREGVVAVRRRTYEGTVELLINQEVQGDDSPLARRVQRLQGVLPLVLTRQDRPRRAIVIGLGTGTTVAPLTQAGIERITVAELVRPVVQVALSDFLPANNDLRAKTVREFEPDRPTGEPTTVPSVPASGRPASPRPGRASQVRILHADGRTLLRLAPGGWDLILVDIIFPTAPGAANLFSRQFYRLAYDRLGEDGLFVHWLPLWQVRPQDAASVVAAFLTGFQPPGVAAGGATAPLRIGFVALPQAGRPMVALVGARRPIELGRERLAGRIEQLRDALESKSDPDQPALADVGLGTADQVWAGLLTGPLLSRWADGAEPTTDDHPRTELRGPLGNQAGFGSGNIAELLRAGYADADYANQVAASAAAGMDYDVERMAKVFRSRRLLAEAQAGQGPPSPERDKKTGQLLTESVAADPENAFAKLSLGRLRYELDLAAAIERRQAAVAALGDGRRADSLRVARELIGTLTRIDQRFPYDLPALEEKAALQQWVGQLRAALDTLEGMIRRAPRSADARYHKARVLAAVAREEQSAGRLQAARKSAEQAKAALDQARRLRSRTPAAYRRLADRIAALTAAATTQPTRSND